MAASLLYHKKFVKTLKSNGFQLNTYDNCVANLMVHYKQQTILFHLDDCKLNHQDSKVGEEFVNILLDEYDSVFEDGYGKMKVIQEKLYDHLGITLYYIVKGQLNITIMNYIKEIMECFDKSKPKSSGTKSSATTLNLFVVDEECEKLRK